MGFCLGSVVDNVDTRALGFEYASLSTKWTRPGVTNYMELGPVYISLDEVVAAVGRHQPPKFQPYDMAVMPVEPRIGQNYRRPVQVMSYPIPSKLVGGSTIMVRTTPGLAATLREVNMSLLTKATEIIHWVTFGKITATRIGVVPFDMLRYDNFYLDDFDYQIFTGGEEDYETRNISEGTQLTIFKCAKSRREATITRPDRWLSMGWRLDVAQVKKIGADGNLE
jgi:hypothetical protein